MGTEKTTVEEAGEVLCYQFTATNSSKQTGRNSRTNISHTLGRMREATARKSSTKHYGLNKLNTAMQQYTKRKKRERNLIALPPE